MRALVVRAGPHFSVADVCAGWVEGLRELGVQVVDFNLDDRLGFYSCAGTMRDGEFAPLLDEAGAARLAAKGIEAACFEWWPDFVLIVSCFYVPLDILEVLRARRMKVVILHTESPYEDARQLARAPAADLNILNDPTNLDRFVEVAPTVYLPHAYRPGLHHPAPATPKYSSDFCLVGTGYPSRVEFLEAVDWAGVDVALAGNWGDLAEGSPLRKFVAHDIDECVDNDQAVELYRSTRASVNIYRREAEHPDLVAGWAMGPREVELAATGTFFLTEARGENRAVLPMVPTFTGPEDFGAQLHWWLDHDDERRAVADAARAAVAERTFAANAAELLRHLTD